MRKLNRQKNKQSCSRKKELVVQELIRENINSEMLHLQECNINSDSEEAANVPTPPELKDYILSAFAGRRTYNIQDQFHEAKSKGEKEIQEADTISSTSSCGPGQGDSTPLCTTEESIGELLSLKDTVPISSVKAQASITAASQDVYHKELPAASVSSVLEAPISSRPHLDLGSRPSYLQIARGATVKNHNEVFQSENSAARGPSVLEPPTNPKPCSDLGLKLSYMKVGRYAIVEGHNEERVDKCCKSLPNNSSVGGIGATETLPSTNAQNLCSMPSSYDSPESRTRPNAAQENSQQVYADAQGYNPRTTGNLLVKILLEVPRTIRVMQCGSYSRTSPSSPVSPLEDFPPSQEDLHQSERRNTKDHHGNSQAASPRQSHQQGAHYPTNRQSEMLRTEKHEEHNPGRSSDDSNLQMGASQGYQDQTPSDTTSSDFETPSGVRRYQPWEH